MTPIEKQIWDLVHSWCDQQLHEIPDANRRLLMERILGLFPSSHNEDSKHFKTMSNGRKYVTNNEGCTASTVQSFKKGDLVKFNIILDDSGYASDRFDVEPQNDWLAVEVYVEECFGEIVKKNVIEHIYNDGTRSGKFYKIVNGRIPTEVDELLRKKVEYGLSLSYIFDGSGLRTLKDFIKIEPVTFIPLKTEYKKENCLLNPPQKSIPVKIWNKIDIGYSYMGMSYYENGKWIDNTTKQENKRINEHSFWQQSISRIYINGKIFEEVTGL